MMRSFLVLPGIFLAFTQFLMVQALTAGCPALTGPSNFVLTAYSSIGCTGSKEWALQVKDKACTQVTELTTTSTKPVFVMPDCTSGSYGLYTNSSCLLSMSQSCQTGCLAYNTGKVYFATNTPVYIYFWGVCVSMK